MLITAICPHSLVNRPIVVHVDAKIEIEPLPPWHDEVLVSFDGQIPTSLEAGQRVAVERAAEPVLLVRLNDEDFFARIRERLHWSDASGRPEQ